MPAKPSTIELHLNKPEQLYNSLDPSPFHERDLDEEAEKYILGSAREIRSGLPLSMVVTLPLSECSSPMAVHLPDAIRNHFAYRALQTRQNLRELLSLGWRFLAIGLSVLGLCFLAIQWLKISDTSSTFARLLEQSLLILGWVANWRPLEIILYEWLPLWRSLVLQRKLSKISVTVRPAPG